MWKIMVEETGNLNNPAHLYKRDKFEVIKKIWNEQIEPLWDYSWGPLYDNHFVITNKGVRYWLKPDYD